MGYFDDALKNAVPGGNLATPIAVAVGALILGKLFGGGSSPAPAPAAPAPAPVPASLPTNPPDLQHHRRLERPDRPADGGRRGPAGQFLGRPRTERPDPARPAWRRAGRRRARRDLEAHRHEPAGAPEPARGRPAAGDQQPDPEGAGADGRRSRGAVSFRRSANRRPIPPRCDAARPPCRALGRGPRSGRPGPRARPTA